MKEFDYHDFLQGAPVMPGDIIDVASDLLSILLFCRKRKLAFHAERLLDALQELVGADGTVMIRAFNWDFCHGIPFDIRNSPSRVGSLGNYASARGDFSRTRHPIYSWWVWGKHKDAICEIDEPSAFAEGGVFGFLYRRRGKQVGLGNLPNAALTQLHYAEAAARAPYRREKAFCGDYIDERGKSEKRTYSMHVRPLNMDVTSEELDGKETQDEMRAMGIRTDQVYQQELLCTVFDLKEATDFIKTDILSNDGKKVVRINQHRGITASAIQWEQAEY